MTGPALPVDLVSVLDLVGTDEDAFEGECPTTALQQVFGGQIVAQALVAATRTVGEDRDAHSLHAYFLSRGEPGVRLAFAVERLRDGRTFSARRVLVSQRGRPLLSMEASFARPEDPLVEFAQLPTDVRPPEDYADAAEADGFLQGVMRAEFPAWDVRRVLDRTGREAGMPVQRVWLRHRDPLPDDPALQRCALAFLSDMTLLSCGLAGLARSDGLPVIASLDHAVWFQREPRVDEWLLYDQVSPAATGGRTVNLGRLHDRDGVLVAVVAQEGLVRRLQKPAG